VYSKTKDRKKAFAAGVLTSMAVGIFKESLDATRPGNKFDLKDLAATTLGGITVSFTINLFDKKKKNKKRKK
jgi:VanZ family protein